jgi:hypothetical protein
MWRERLAEFPALAAAAGEGRVDGGVVAMGLLWPNYWPAALDVGPGHAPAAWRQMQRVLDACRAEADAMDIRMAVAFIPGRIQYDRGYQEFLRAFGHHVRERWLTEDSRFQRALARWCGDGGVPFADLTAAFRSHDEPSALSTRYTGRLTPAGHEVVAGGLLPLVRRVLSE